MPRDFKLYLHDMKTAIERIEASLQGIDKNTFQNTPEKVDSVLFNLLTIGEAAKQIPQYIRDKKPDVAWVDIGRFRDFIAHHYFDINKDQVWKILQTDISELKSQLDDLLEILSTEEENHGKE